MAKRAGLKFIAIAVVGMAQACRCDVNRAGCGAVTGTEPKLAAFA